MNQDKAGLGQGSCVFGCNANVYENFSGKIITTKNGKEKQEDWEEADYTIRCPGSDGFDSWYVYLHSSFSL